MKKINNLWTFTAKQLVKDGLVTDIPAAFVLVGQKLQTIRSTRDMETAYYESSKTFKQLIVKRYYELLSSYSLIKLGYRYRELTDPYLKSIISLAYKERAGKINSIKNLIDEHEVCPPRLNFILEMRIAELAKDLSLNQVEDFSKQRYHHNDCSYIFRSLMEGQK